jgi:hypothetical protein
MTIASDVQEMEKRVGVFLTAHHLVLYLLLAVGAFGLVYLGMSKYADIQAAKAEAAQQALAIEKDHSAQMLATLKQAQEALAAVQAQRERDNAASQAQMAQIVATLQAQIAKDKTLPAPALGHRIETITGFKQDTITIDAKDNLIVPQPLAVDIVVRLDQGQADAQTVVQQEKIIVNQTATIADQAKIIAQQEGVIAEDKVVLTKQIDTDNKQINKLKADLRKGRLKWFGIGVVTGFVGRQFVKFGV